MSVRPTDAIRLKTWMAHIESLKLAITQRERELQVANLTDRRRTEISLYLARYRRQVKDAEDRVRYLQGQMVVAEGDKW